MNDEDIMDKIDTFLEKARPDIRDRYFILKSLIEQHWLDIQGYDEDLEDSEEETEEIGSEEENTDEEEKPENDNKQASETDSRNEKEE